MAAMDFFTQFETLWAQTGQVEAIEDNQYKAGWAYIGATPPSVEQFNKVQQLSDQKAAWLFAQIKALATALEYELSADDTNALINAFGHYATTEWVVSNGVRFSPRSRYHTSTAQLVLAVEDIGAKISFNANSNQTAKLPPTTGLPVGSTIYLSRGGNYLATISTDDGSAKIDGQAGALLSSLELRSGEEVALMWTGAVWLSSGTYSFRISQLGASLGASGWKRMGDVIVQWGHVDSGSATSGTITFPIAFPTACRSVVAHDYGATASDVSNVRLAPPTKTSVAWVGQTFQAQPSIPGVWTWQAIGD